MIDQASRSAGLVAGARALESIAPLKQRIITDQYAAYFVTGRFERLAKFADSSLASGLAYRLVTFYTNQVLKRKNGAISVSLRHRFIDNQLLSLLESGIKQVVLLGAGYDSRAIRLCQPGVNFIEIDHPATQAEKLKRLNRIPNLPSYSVQYLSTDFQENWLQEIQAQQTIQPIPTVFIWEGVSMYLPEKAIHHTLDALKQLCPNGHLLLDVISKKGLLAWQSQRNPAMNTVIDPNEEPFVFGIDRENIADLFTPHQYQLNEVTTAQEFAQHLAKNTGIQIREFENGGHAMYVHASFE